MSPWESCHVPDDCKKTMITLPHTVKEEKNSCENHKGISVLTMFCKVPGNKGTSFYHVR